jgi:hypothetical protein
MDRAEEENYAHGMLACMLAPSKKRSRIIKFLCTYKILHDYAALTRAGDACGLGHLGAFFGAV